jgi:hypothetical protein
VRLFLLLYSEQLIASTSERGITVLLEVVDHVGRSAHNQTLHFNKTSTVLFTVPAGLDVSDSATLQVGLVPLHGQTTPRVSVHQTVNPAATQLMLQE